MHYIVGLYYIFGIILSTHYIVGQYTQFELRNTFSTTLSALTPNGEAAWRRRGDTIGY